MSPIDPIARNLAAAFLDGDWARAGLQRRGAQALGGRQRGLTALARRCLQAFAAAPDGEALARFLSADEGFRAICAAHFRRGEMPRRRLFWLTPRMAPAAGPPEGWQVPALATTSALADWLGLTPSQLDWFADVQQRERRTPAGPLRHYTYTWLVRPRGKRRLLEQPKARLKALQRRVLHDILDRIPPHEAAHGYRAGRSILSYAAPHVGQLIVLRIDVRDFFASITAARVRALFRTAGYPSDVARALAGLCTNAVPVDVLGEAAAGLARFRSPHLPQGAPTSPALANLCAFRLDCRLARLASRSQAAYTRYADDLAFSGGEELARGARRFHVAVCRILLEAGFEINPRKTRFMRRHARQHLAGVVLNERLNGRRADYDRLEAILTNCVRHGPAGQNRAGVPDFRAHLLGRIAHLGRLNPGRGQRLRSLFERIAWEA